MPPAASFVCSPTSIRVRTGKHTYTRFTYFATKRQGHQRLDCFEERFENDQPQGLDNSGLVLSDAFGDIAFLEIIPIVESIIDGSTQHTIHALFRSGTLRRYSSNVRQEYTAIELSGIAYESSSIVLAARWSTPGDARSSTLKHRPDLVASTDSTTEYLSVLYRRKSADHTTAHVGIWPIPSAGQSLVRTQSTAIAALVSYALPESHLWLQEADIDCSFNAKATSVLATGIKGAVSYDLSGYTPRTTWEQQISDHGLSSVRINASFVMTSTTASLMVHDTKYNCSRASLDVTRIGNKRKRERGGPGITRGFVRIIGFFPQLQKVVTMRRNHLLSFELSGGRKETMLIDSLGCGLPDQARPRHHIKLPKLEIGMVDDLSGIPSGEWVIVQQKLVEMAEAGDAASFEVTALKAARDPDSLSRLSESQIEFLMSRIFRIVHMGSTDGENGIPDRQCLQIGLPAYTLITMLIEHGALTPHRLLQALRTVPHAVKAPCLAPGIIPAALIESDRSFALLKTWLDSAELVNAAELATTVGTLINLLQAEAHTDASLSTTLMIEDKGNKDEDGLQSEQPSVKRILISALERLASYGPGVIVGALKSSLVQTETLTLVQLLRQQLFEGQHTLSLTQISYPSPPPSAHSSLEDRISEPILSLDATSKMLLGCIDAIGPLGFFANKGKDEFIANLVPDLKSEALLAMKGLEEASFLQGVLRETIRYAESTNKDAFPDTGVSWNEDAAPPARKPGTIVTLYSEPSLEQGDVDTTAGMLPLSLHAENTIALTKMRKGGGQIKDRSLREVREIENRNKGRYSFERLVL